MAANLTPNLLAADQQPESVGLAMLRAIAARTQAPVFARDVDGRFLVANSAYAAPLRYGPEALLGRHLDEVFDPGEAAEMAAEDRQVVVEGRPVVVEPTLRMAGAERRFLLVKYPLLADDGTPLGIAGIATDITGREHAMPGLSEEHFRFAFDQAPIGAALIGLDLSFRRVNKALCRMTGYSEAELLHRGGFTATHPGDVTAELRAILLLVSGDEDEIALEKRFLRPDGTIVWANLHLRLLRGTVGEPVAYLAFVENLTAQKSTLAVIEHRERVQRAVAACAERLVDNASDAAEERRALEAALGYLCVGVSMLRVNVWENYVHPQEGFSFRLFARAAVSPKNFYGEFSPVLAYAPWSFFPRAYVSTLQAGEPCGGPVELLFREAPAALALAREAGLGSVLAIPITVDGQWWGKLQFNDRTAREWDEQEVLLLRTAAGIIGSFLQRNRAVAALREREAMLRALGDNLPDAYIYQIEEFPDGSSRRTYMSRGLEPRTGVSAEQALAHIDAAPLNMHPDDVPAYEATKAAARAAFSLYAFEHRYFAVDGSLRWVNARSSPRLADGRKLWDGIVFDTTSLKQLQEELRQANAGLNQRVDQLSLLNRVTHLLGGMTNLQSTLQIVCQLLRDAFHAAEVLVALHDYPRHDLKLVAHSAGASDGQIDQLASLDAIAARLAERGDLVLIEEEAHPAQMRLAVVLQSQERSIGLLSLRVDQEGRQLTPDVVSLAQTIAGAIANAAINAQLYERAVQSSERLERLNAASGMINGAGLDLAALYAAIHRAVAHLMPVECFVIYLVEPESELVEYVYSHDIRTGLWGPGREPLAQSFAGFMCRSGTSLRVDDFLEFYQRHPEVGFSMYGDEEDTRSGLAASFLTADGLYGLLFAQCYPPGAYTNDDLIILELLAAHAATAIENARRAQQTRRDAIDEERNRLARDLHDSVTQSLFSASLIAERLPAMAGKSADEGREGLELVNRIVRGALAEMRALLVELRPAALAAAPLHEAVDQLTRTFGGRRSITIKVDLDPAPQLPQAVQVALYRIVQESLSNVIKHARARSVTVEMKVQPRVINVEGPWSGTITIRVRDDGRGFQPEQVGAGAFGIGIMRERAAAVGAQLDLDSQPGQGTLVTLVWGGTSAQEDGS